MDAKALIESGKTALGIELGSTRIKGVLIDLKGRVLAVGIHDWENSFVDNIWTYSLEDIHAGIRNCYTSLRKEVEKTYGVTLKTTGAIGISAMMHGYMALDKDGNQIAEYLTSNQAKGIIQKYLKDILKNNGEVTITPEQIKELLTSVMSDFQSWLTEQNANPGAEEFGTYFQQYLQTGRANAIVNKWANEIFGDIDFNISSDTLQAMAKELADGYTAYAKEKNYADPTKMAENFVNYIKTDDGKRRLTQGLSEAINMDSLQKQISTAMSSCMGQAMSAYTGAHMRPLNPSFGLVAFFAHPSHGSLKSFL